MEFFDSCPLYVFCGRRLRVLSSFPSQSSGTAPTLTWTESHFRAVLSNVFRFSTSMASTMPTSIYVGCFWTVITLSSSCVLLLFLLWLAPLPSCSISSMVKSIRSFVSASSGLILLYSNFLVLVGPLLRFLISTY